MAGQYGTSLNGSERLPTKGGDTIWGVGGSPITLKGGGAGTYNGDLGHADGGSAGGVYLGRTATLTGGQGLGNLAGAPVTGGIQGAGGGGGAEGTGEDATGTANTADIYGGEGVSDNITGASLIYCEGGCGYQDTAPTLSRQGASGDGGGPQVRPTSGVRGSGSGGARNFSNVDFEFTTGADGCDGAIIVRIAA